ncbi:MAG TPA: PKD domain-containing protein, partial [Polyangium sp.]|nr:PKD domain-containing protein [Polyangium sp.]
MALCVVAGCGDDGGASTSPSADADGDGISNADEGNSTNVNTDGDEFPDWLDYDSDGDGILDADEAGDKDLTTAVRDTDADGAPDFRDIDSDGDGWKDNQELDAAFAIVDTDGDGTPDFVDLDSDGDSISDKHEFAGEPDKDNIPNFRDDDSDGDGIKDALEAGDADIVSPPVDTDGDMIPDFLDVDSDGDFVPDAQEDPNGNGMVDPGESSPLSADTDGDGTPDLVTSDTLVTHTYYTDSLIQNITVTMIAVNACGSDTASWPITVQPNTITAFFNTDTTLGCAPLTVNFTQLSIGVDNWYWNFGDGNFSVAYSPTHTYTQGGTFIATLYGDNGCSYDTVEVYITVQESPDVDFSFAPDPVCGNAPIQFTNLTPFVAATDWSFGDGDTSDLSDPVHVYNAPGTYPVTLTVVSAQNDC